MRYWSYLVVAGLLLSPAAAQSSPSTSTQDMQSEAQMEVPSENTLGWPFLKHMASDQKTFWTGIPKWGVNSKKESLPLAALAGLTFASDPWIMRQVPDAPSQLRRSRTVSQIGVFSLIGATGGSLLLGRLTRNDHLQETGLLSAEAMLNSTAVAWTLKGFTQRQRPLEGSGGRQFFQGGNSFPSEHSALAWSAASVIAHEYPGPLTKIAAYGLASAVTVSRVTSKEHFASDALIGSALGWYIGRQVYRAHHDPELGGAPWGDVFENRGELPRSPARMGSTYVPLDSWIYPALDRLAAFGYINMSFSGIRPWSRLECARLTEEAGEALDRESAASADLNALQARLREELAYEFGLLGGDKNFKIGLDSVYARAVSISGPALTDSFHFGQTVAYDFGRPDGRGTSGQIGGSFQFATGPLAVYVRAEFQHAPSLPALSDTVRNFIAQRDQIPLPPGFAAPAINRPRLLDAYVTLNLNRWQISVGKQSLSWAPGPGGSLLMSNNAEPLTIIRLTKAEPFRLPGVLKFLGPAQLDNFLGRLEGHSFIPHSLIYGQKINFKPIPSLELGFGRTVILGGHGGDAFTAGNLLRSFFGQQLGKGSVPGDAHSSMDWSYRIPKLHDYVVFYGEVYADDDFLPWQNPAKNPFRPGIYITRIPGVPKLDFHMEATSTESPGFLNGNNQGQLNYWNFKYHDGYTQNGNLIGNTVGRNGRALQTWFTYWLSPSSTLQFTYKHNSVSSKFVPGGGAWQDYGVQSQTYFRSGFYLKTHFQYEYISRYPMLFSGPQNNVAAIVEFGLNRLGKK